MATEAQASNVAGPSNAAPSNAAPSNAEPSTFSETSTSGRVKWFNNKAGYGFITVLDCETNEERDLFVHHSEIKVEQTQYKYLVQGEYVEFTISPIARGDKVDCHSTNVRGINGGKLMCETRNEIRSYRSAQPPAQQSQAQQSQAQPSKAHAQPSKAPAQPSKAPAQSRQTQPSQVRQSDQRRPQLDKADQTEWMVVPRRRTDTPRQKNQPRQPVIEIA